MPIVKLLEDKNGDLLLPLDEKTLEVAGLKIGDAIEWVDNHDGSFTLAKKTKTKIIMVEAISSYRMRYAIEIPADADESWAKDTVTMQEANEFSQEWLGETITSSREISQVEFLTQFRKDNEYLASWDDDQCFVTGLNAWGSIEK